MVENFEDILDPITLAVEQYGFTDTDILVNKFLVDLLLQTRNMSYSHQQYCQPPASKRRSLEPIIGSPLKELNLRPPLMSHISFESTTGGGQISIPNFGGYVDDMTAKLNNVARNANDLNWSAVADVDDDELDCYLGGALQPITSAAEITPSYDNQKENQTINSSSNSFDQDQDHHNNQQQQQQQQQQQHNHHQHQQHHHQQQQHNMHMMTTASRKRKSFNMQSPVVGLLESEGSDSQSSLNSSINCQRDKKRESLESSISGVSSTPSLDLAEDNNNNNNSQMSLLQNDKNVFRCKICHRVMKRFRIYQQHMEKHSEETMATGGRYQCEKCGQRFATKIFKREHIMHEHSEGKTKLFNYHCDICDRTFAQRSNLDVHMRQHTGERPYKCTICSRRFRQKAHLDKHMEKLHDIDVRSNKAQAKQLTKIELKCAKCAAVFETRFKLRVHEKTHGGDITSLAGGQHNHPNQIHQQPITTVLRPQSSSSNDYNENQRNSFGGYTQQQQQQQQQQQNYDNQQQLWNGHLRSRSVTPTVNCHSQLVKSEFHRPNSEPIEKNYAYTFEPIVAPVPTSVGNVAMNGHGHGHFVNLAQYDNNCDAINAVRSLTRHYSADNLRPNNGNWLPEPWRMS